MDRPPRPARARSRTVVPVAAGTAHRMGREAARVLDWLCPPACVLCNASGERLCSPCRSDATAGLRCCCPRCALPLTGGDAGRPCGRCVRRLPTFDRTCAAATYEAPFSQVIRGFKYGAMLAYAPLLADLLHARIARSDDPMIRRVDLLVPVPLSRERMAARGFNQSIEIARLLGRRLGVSLDRASVLRIHDTSPQAALAFASRRRNVRGAFAVPDGRKTGLAGRRVAVVDDVMTTGATLDELARTLKRAGAASVCNFVVARTP